MASDLAAGGRDAVAALAHDPARTAVVCDFDGTLSPIVDDPRASRPHPDVPGVLGELAHRFALVAVVSGRPGAFLLDRLGGDDGVVLAGLYGLERVEGGAVRLHPDAEPWLAPVTDAAAAAEAAAPPGVYVEHKGLTVTIHVRNAREHAGWAQAWAEQRAAATGLAVHPGKLSWELRPPVAVDKGTVVLELVAGLDAACFVGDDIGDLPAFQAIAAFTRGGGGGVRVGVRSDEAPPELLAAADVVVEGTDGVVAFLRALLAAAG